MPVPASPKYTGSYGVFLQTINRRSSPLANEIIAMLKKYENRIEMKELIVSLEATASDIVETVGLLQKQNTVLVHRTGNFEIVLLA